MSTYILPLVSKTNHKSLSNTAQFLSNTTYINRKCIYKRPSRQMVKKWTYKPKTVCNFIFFAFCTSIFNSKPLIFP